MTINIMTKFAIIKTYFHFPKKISLKYENSED